MGHSRKHPYHPHGGNWKLTPLPPSDVLIHLLLSETILSPLPLRTAEISSVGGSVDLFWNDPIIMSYSSMHGSDYLLQENKIKAFLLLRIDAENV